MLSIWSNPLLKLEGLENLCLQCCGNGGTHVNCFNQQGNQLWDYTNFVKESFQVCVSCQSSHT